MANYETTVVECDEKVVMSKIKKALKKSCFRWDDESDSSYVSSRRHGDTLEIIESLIREDGILDDYKDLSIRVSYQYEVDHYHFRYLQNHNKENYFLEDVVIQYGIIRKNSFEIDLLEEEGILPEIIKFYRKIDTIKVLDDERYSFDDNHDKEITVIFNFGNNKIRTKKEYLYLDIEILEGDLKEKAEKLLAQEEKSVDKTTF